MVCHISVPIAVSLTINGSGSLATLGRDGGAGIGGNALESTGNITICLDPSGSLIATGGEFAAGIGSGSFGAGGKIFFCVNNEGFVGATGGRFGAGIGSGGNGASSGSITINNGEIVAQGGQGAAGIGGGYLIFTGGIVNILGGDITATGGQYGAGIGSGGNGMPLSINISGGKVTATGTDFGAGIGGGLASHASIIDINGGVVYASSGAAIAQGAQDIGRGGLAPTGGTLSLSGTADVFLENLDTGSLTPLPTLPYSSLDSNPPGYDVPATWTYPIGFYGKLDPVVNPQTGHTFWEWLRGVLN